MECVVQNEKKINFRGKINETEKKIHKSIKKDLKKNTN